MWPTAASSQVTQQLAELRDEDPDAFEAVRERIRLIRTDPGDPRFRGVTAKVPDGPLGRAVSVPVATAVWILVWGVEEDTVVFIHLEQSED